MSRVVSKVSPAHSVGPRLVAAAGCGGRPARCEWSVSAIFFVGEIAWNVCRLILLVLLAEVALLCSPGPFFIVLVPYVGAGRCRHEPFRGFVKCIT